MLLLPPNSIIFRQFQAVCAEKRVVFFAGIPGVGKSLWLQQFVLMAHEAGRVIHTLQWDVTRQAFETPDILAKYPEIDGVTHAGIRKAVGLWARQAIQAWHESHPDPNHILIGEMPLVGNRLIEVMQKGDDAVEKLLASEQTHCFIPVPSLAVRETIEAKRAQSIASPQHEKEAKDAPPNVLQMLWAEVNMLDGWLGGELDSETNQLTNQPTNQPKYNPAVYSKIFQHLLRHRHYSVLDVDRVYQTVGSPYELGDAITEGLVAGEGEIAGILHHIETHYTPKSLEKAVANWYNL